MASAARARAVSFPPSNILPGISWSPDKMLQSRIFSYADAHRYWVGAHYELLPMNRPAHDYHLDGAVRFDAPPIGCLLLAHEQSRPHLLGANLASCMISDHDGTPEGPRDSQQVSGLGPERPGDTILRMVSFMLCRQRAQGTPNQVRGAGGVGRRDLPSAGDLATLPVRNNVRVTRRRHTSPMPWSIVGPSFRRELSRLPTGDRRRGAVAVDAAPRRVGKARRLFPSAEHFALISSSIPTDLLVFATAAGQVT